MALGINAAVWAASGAAAAVGMELWSRWIHRALWHGPFWRLHRSHHAPRGRLEANDLLPLSHAPVAAGLILYGCLGSPGLARELAFGVGAGMTLFGVTYTVVHDGLVHRRFPVGPLRRWRRLEAIRIAHLEHHRRGEAPFGMFLGPRELQREGGIRRVPRPAPRG